MSNPARLQAALRRLEERRRQLEELIVTELEDRYFSESAPRIATIAATHDGSHVEGANLDTTGISTSASCHTTVVWFHID